MRSGAEIRMGSRVCKRSHNAAFLPPRLLSYAVDADRAPLTIPWIVMSDRIECARCDGTILTLSRARSSQRSDENNTEVIP